MKIAVYGPSRRVGLIDGDRLIDANNAAAAFLETKMNEDEARANADHTVPPSLRAFIEQGREALELVQLAFEYAKGSEDPSISLPLSDVRLSAPWPERRIFCAGANYTKHVADYYTNRGNPTSEEQVYADSRAGDPAGFAKNLVEVMGPGDEVTYPARSDFFDYEAEVAIIIGKKAKDVPPGHGSEYIWGVTLANDWSDRTLAGAGRIALSFNLMKNFDCSLSLGPCVAVGEVEAQDVDVTLRVNGDLRQQFNSKGMIYSFAEYIEFLTRDFTLVPGDIILGGTDFGTAADASERAADGTPARDLFLNDGDVVEIESPQIGRLVSKIVPKRVDGHMAPDQ